MEAVLLGFERTGGYMLLISNDESGWEDGNHALASISSFSFEGE